ncbi:tyrosine-type recombinase/integrase [Pseudogracilibacillus sp. SE30717A]|uniref:tyrosine-type recombinase/integrase n=1 Tax=Pseudogracilibacillus sp. SE30717A TaxID=3098293 RepID=UPI00300E025F
MKGKRAKRKRQGVSTKSERTSVRQRAFDTRLEVIFSTFIRDRKAEGVGDRAVEDYEYSFKYLLKYLDLVGEEHDIRNVTEDVIRDYIVHMQEETVKFEGHPFKTDKDKEKGLSVSTINTRIKSLRTLFNRLETSGAWEGNIFKNIKNLRQPVERIEILTPKEIRELLRIPDRRSYAGFRDYVIIHFLLDSMIRIGEAVQLIKSDFDFGGRSVTVPAHVAKNKNFRIVPLSDKTLRLIKELIEENETDFDSEYIFLTNYGEPIDSERFRTRLKEFVKQTSIKKNVYPHLLRHTAATSFLQNGGDIRHLQMILGHADLRMVQRYTHLSNPSLARQHGRYTIMNDLEGKLEKPRKIKR